MDQNPYKSPEGVDPLPRLRWPRPRWPTLVEWLVIAAVICVLLALLLPPVQSASSR